MTLYVLADLDFSDGSSIISPCVCAYDIKDDFVGVVAADVSLTVMEDVLSDAVSGSTHAIYVVTNSSLLVAASESGVSINGTTGQQILATKCPNGIIATSAQILADHGWPLKQVLFVDGYFIEAVMMSSFGGMDLPTPWTLVIVQEVDCDAGQCFPSHIRV